MAVLKPPAGARPTPGHPFTVGLRHAFLLNERSGKQVRDCVTGMHGTITGTLISWTGGLVASGYTRTIHGSSVHLDGTTYITGFDGAVFSRAAGAGPFTVVAGISIAGVVGGAYQTIWGPGGEGFYINPSAQLMYYPYTAGHTFVAADYGQPHVVSASWDPSGLMHYMFDGQTDVAPVAAATALLSASSGLGGHGSEYLYGDISFLYVYDRFIPPSLMAEIHADPFAGFVPSWRTALLGALSPSTAVVPDFFGPEQLRPAHRATRVFGRESLGEEWPLYAGPSVGQVLQVPAEVAAQATNPILQVYQLAVEAALQDQSPPSAQVFQVAVEVAYPFRCTPVPTVPAVCPEPIALTTTPSTLPSVEPTPEFP